MLVMSAWFQNLMTAPFQNKKHANLKNTVGKKWSCQADSAPKVDPDAFSKIREMDARLAADKALPSDAVEIAGGQEQEAGPVTFWPHLEIQLLKSFSISNVWKLQFEFPLMFDLARLPRSWRNFWIPCCKRVGNSAPLPETCVRTIQHAQIPPSAWIETGTNFLLLTYIYKPMIQTYCVRYTPLSLTSISYIMYPLRLSAWGTSIPWKKAWPIWMPSTTSANWFTPPVNALFGKMGFLILYIHLNCIYECSDLVHT